MGIEEKIAFDVYSALSRLEEDSDQEYIAREFYSKLCSCGPVEINQVGDSWVVGIYNIEKGDWLSICPDTDDKKTNLYWSVLVSTMHKQLKSKLNNPPSLSNIN